MSNLMLDLETVSLSSTGGIIAIGACRFNRYGLIDTFYQNITLNSLRESNFHIDSYTLQWWEEQGEQSREVFINGLPVKVVLEMFSKWLNTYVKNTLIWGNGVDFDNLILSNAYKRLNMKLPWDYKLNRCYKTIISCLGGDTKPLVYKTNGLENAISQAINLINLVRQTGINSILL